MRRRSSRPNIAAPSQVRVQRIPQPKMHPSVWRLHIPFTILLLMVSALLLQLSARSQTPTLDPATAVPGSAPSKVTPRGLKAGVVAATDTSGNLEMATRGLAIANAALSRSPGYSVVGPREVAGSLSKSNIRWPFTTVDYQKLRKTLKIDRALAVAVTPGDISDSSAAYTAVVELYDTATGGLVGRGEGTSTYSPPPAPADATAGAPTEAPPADATTPPADTNATAPAAATAGTTLPDAPVVNNDWQLRAVDAAVINAVNAMNQPASLQGIVISRTDGYLSRISLGELQGVRNGTRIEYLSNGQVIAYGTIIELGRGDSLVTVAPEAAAPAIHGNMVVRTATIPALGLAGPTSAQIEEKEWKKFEKDFGISAAIAGAAYLIFK